jgi:hypothetical protein
MMNAFKSILAVVGGLSLCFGFTSDTAIANPFLALNADRVVAYEFDGRHEQQLVYNGKVLPIYTKSMVLRKSQIDSLEQIITDTATYNGVKYACFEPRLCVVYFKQQEILAHVNICFECAWLSSSVPIPAETYYDVPVDYGIIKGNGFSVSGKEKLYAWCKKTGFNHCQQ